MLPTALAISLVGLMETRTSIKTDTSTELRPAVINIVSSLFGGMVLLGPSLMNVDNGGRSSSVKG